MTILNKLGTLLAARLPMSDTASAHQAITAALAQDWHQAIRVNTAILAHDDADVDALCRLAHAYLKTGQMGRAKDTYQRVLSADPYHQLALKNLKKLGVLRRKDMVEKKTATVSPLVFLEDPGKTKIVECVHLAPAQTLSSLTSGQEVYLKAKNHCVEIRDANKRYLAALPDDLSFKLLKFLSAGNRYQTIVKGVKEKSLSVFLREVSRGKRFRTQPSFSSSVSYIPAMRPVQETVETDSSDVPAEAED